MKKIFLFIVTVMALITLMAGGIRAETATLPWTGTYSCEICGPAGGSSADGNGPTPCWDYNIKIPQDGLLAEIHMTGFQTDGSIIATVRPGRQWLELEFARNSADAIVPAPYKAGEVLLRLSTDHANGFAAVKLLAMAPNESTTQAVCRKKGRR